LAVFLGLVLLPARAPADFEVLIEPVPPPAGDGPVILTPGNPTQVFRVYLQTDTAVTDAQITAFSALLELTNGSGGPPPAGVNFLGGDYPTDNSYIFQDNSDNQILESLTGLSFPLAVSNPPTGFPSPGIALGDSPFDPFPALLTGDANAQWTLGMVTVGLTGGSADGSYKIQFVQDPTFTAVTDENFTPISNVTFTPTDSFSVQGTADVTAVPAPPGAVLFGMGGVGLLVSRLTRRSRPAIAA
jgi:hypothetical protein